MLPVMRNGLIIVSLHAFDIVLDKEVHDLVHKRRIPAQVAEVIYLFSSRCLTAASYAAFRASMFPCMSPNIANFI